MFHAKTRVALLLLMFAAGHAWGAISPERLQDLTSGWEIGARPLLTNSHNLYNPCVLHEPESEYPFKMWFFGWAVADVDPRYTGDAIFFARSRSLHDWEVYAGGTNWERNMNARAYAPVMTATPSSGDGMANGDPSVVKRGDTYYMALSSVGFDTRKDQAGTARLYNVSCILGATSKDGIHWQKTAAPILIWNREFTQPWEIVDGKIPPAPANYYGSYHRPSLLFDQGRWKLWFDYFVPGTFVSLGYAENTGDFTNASAWKVLRADADPLLKDFPNPSVIKANGQYLAFSDAPYYPPELGGDGRQLTLAVSPDGITWKVLGHLRPAGMASSHVPQALVLPIEGVNWVYVFYSWKPARQPGEPWDFRYKELRYLRRKLDQLLP